MNSQNGIRRFAVVTSALCCALASFPIAQVREAAAAEPAAPHAATATPTASESLELLQQGNARFVSGKPQHPRQSASHRHELVAGQHPIAAILGCSDSRVPLELVFDQGLGDLFVIRVAGNVGGTEDLGSLEYAVDHLHSPLIVVLGHEACGAVTAALLPEADRKKEDQAIQQLLMGIVPALKNIDPSLSPAERVHQGVEANVRMSVQRLKDSEDLMRPHEGPVPTIVGAVYDLDSGKVRWLK
jgi:carbonic anhydrase